MKAHTALALTLLMSSVAPASFSQPDEHRHDHAAPTPGTAAKPVVSEPTGALPGLVYFPDQLRDHTLANMRDHLRALGEIQEQVAKQNYNGAAEIAEQRLGMTSLKRHGAHEVAKYMPPGMQQAGSTMHRAASKFALVAQESAVDRDMGKSVAALATLTQACVACHASYRLR